MTTIFTGSRVAVRYAATWADGFGARGWKLEAALAEAEVIAATPYPGERIPTSVFVHDILDHHVSGFALSGHRAEAKALVQLAVRTGSDPTPDYQQMVDEDLMSGDCHGEALDDFLPPVLAERLPAHGSARERMLGLRRALGDGLVRATLTARFLELGWAGMAEARSAWRATGLDFERRAEMGLALQRLFQRLDDRVRGQGWQTAAGELLLGNGEVAFRWSSDPAPADREPVGPA
ncbi:MAG TPA: hypothetical protein VKA55_07655 [Gammaproteobacteria bacterium]|nr:hypothetical protein [Gammaproteobacteria bacterium]